MRKISNERGFGRRGAVSVFDTQGKGSISHRKMEGKSGPARQTSVSGICPLSRFVQAGLRRVDSVSAAFSGFS
jgi:hypothetical protein